MKKILALLVSCTLAVSLAGCGSQRDSGQTAENSGKKVRIMIGSVSYTHLTLPTILLV